MKFTVKLCVFPIFTSFKWFFLCSNRCFFANIFFDLFYYIAYTFATLSNIRDCSCVYCIVIVVAGLPSGEQPKNVSVSCFFLCPYLSWYFDSLFEKKMGSRTWKNRTTNGKKQSWKSSFKIPLVQFYILLRFSLKHC